MPTLAVTRPNPARAGSVRLANDPYQYVRRVKGGRWQARPYDDVDRCRYNLGLFPTRDAAASAVRAYWRASLDDRARLRRPRFVLPVAGPAGTRYLALPRLPDGRRVRVGPTFHLPATAAAVALDYLTEHLGADRARELLSGERPNTPDAARRAAERRRQRRQGLTSGQPAGRP